MEWAPGITGNRPARSWVEFEKVLLDEKPDLVLVVGDVNSTIACGLSEAKLVLTDSGGIQKETTVLGIPCLTLRENTERPVTVLQGTNEVIGVNAKRLVTESRKILNGTFKKGKRPDLWDGKAAKRLVDVLVESFKT